jgi:NadR type nicotinamide-nucleotide adenylyltransferase
MKPVNLERSAPCSETFDKGLVVGKFCPLHFGHELLINTALARCRQVIVISYSKPEFAGCERERREAWLQKQFPQTLRFVIDDASLQKEAAKRGLRDVPVIPANDDAECTHRTFVAWLCHFILQCRVDAVFTSEDYGDGFAEVLGEYFKQHNHHNQKAETVRHICVDKVRMAVPVSGTTVRSDPHRHRQFLAGEVYADFVEKVCFLGGESTGKTTLAARMAEELATHWVPEFGRELWERKQGMLQYEDMRQIGETQIKNENALAQQAHRWLFCDTSPLTTLFYSQEIFGRVDKNLQRLAERTYQHLFLCAPDIAFVQDNTRRDDAFRKRQHQWYITELNRRKLPYQLLTGDLSTRVTNVKRVLIKGSVLSPKESFFGFG